MHWGYDFGFGWLVMILVAVFWLLLIAGVIVMIVWAVNRTRIPSGPSAETPLDILKKRYARGEISREEYERMKREIAEE